MAAQNKRRSQNRNATRYIQPDYSQGNLAYDISVYEPKPAAQTQAKPRIEVKHNTAPHQSALGIIAMAAVFLAMMFAMLYGKVETNRLFGEITSLQRQLQSIEAENVSLAAEYDSRTSLKNVEDYAKNTLGLQKLDKSQIEYVEIEGNTVMETVETEKKNIFVIMRNWFASIYEYLGA